MYSGAALHYTTDREREEEEVSGYLWIWRINKMWISQSLSVCDMLKRAFVRVHVEEEKASMCFFSRFGTTFAFFAFAFLFMQLWAFVHLTSFIVSVLACALHEIYWKNFSVLLCPSHTVTVILCVCVHLSFPCIIYPLKYTCPLT